ncbi:MAG: hypothetical protein EXX96DRAFT_604784 [Benjaminiella poitrasii]|nr:MAG: hypothetical protein EXX96DRAFT_604784 [Benjaminiella poitrasii]
MDLPPEQWDFTNTQWNGLIYSGIIASVFSFISNIGVLLIHGITSYYRPIIVNRLSLRMIVLSCLFNLIYCVCQLVTDTIKAKSRHCYALAYVLVSSDTMSCMCLTMVGLNLVMIFVLKKSRTLKLELFYYFLVAVSGILVSIIPRFFGPTPDPETTLKNATCWYFYYFDGRITRVFNWLWYYSWLLLSLFSAASCAAISIRFVIKKQKNFSGTLDMFTRRQDPKEITAMTIIRKYANNNTDIFHKIAVRCICYPLVPLISKSWGVGIEIAAATKSYVPYPIFILDHIFSCLLGFMVSCIYFTDPAIGAIFKESIEVLTRRYVHDYFTVQYLPDPNTEFKSQYPRMLKIVPLTHDINQTPEFMKEVQRRYFGHDIDDDEEHSFHNSRMEAPVSPTVPQIAIHRTSSAYPPPNPNVPTMRLQQQQIPNNNSVSDLTIPGGYNIVRAVSISGNAFMPNELPAEHESETTHVDRKFTNIPMRRVSEIPQGMDYKRDEPLPRYNHPFVFSPKSNEAATVEILIPFKHPIVAKAIHWILLSVFKVKPFEVHHDDEAVETRRFFRDFTDSSDPSFPFPDTRSRRRSAEDQGNNLLTVQQLEKLPSQSLLISQDTVKQCDSGQDDRETLRRQCSEDNKMIMSSRRGMLNDDDSGSSVSIVPLRRVSSVNIANLQRARDKDRIRASFMSTDSSSAVRNRKSMLDDTLKDVHRKSFTSIHNRKFSASLGLSKVLNRGRSMSFSLSRLSNLKRRPSSSTSSSPISHKQRMTALKTTEKSKSLFVTLESPIDNMPVMDRTKSEPTSRSVPEICLSPLTGFSENDESEYDDDRESHSSIEPAPTPISLASSFSLNMQEFPVELSPRPKSQYGKFTIKRQSLPRSTVKSDLGLRRRKETQPQDNFLPYNDQEVSIYLNELFQDNVPSALNTDDNNVVIDHVFQDDSIKMSKDKTTIAKENGLVPESTITSSRPIKKQQQQTETDEAPQPHLTIELTPTEEKSPDIDIIDHAINNISETLDLRTKFEEQSQFADQINRI